MVVIAYYQYIRDHGDLGFLPNTTGILPKTPAVCHTFPIQQYGSIG